VEKQDRHQLKARGVDDEHNIAAQRGGPQRRHVVHVKGQKHEAGGDAADEVRPVHVNLARLID